MFIVYVEHYLTNEGIAFFKSRWFPQVEETLSKQKGFLSLRYEQKEDEKDCLFIDLRFEDETTLEIWCQDPAHDALIAELDRYRSRTYWRSVATFDEEARPEALMWDVNK